MTAPAPPGELAPVCQESRGTEKGPDTWHGYVSAVFGSGSTPTVICAISDHLRRAARCKGATRILPDSKSLCDLKVKCVSKKYFTNPFS